MRKFDITMGVVLFFNVIIGGSFNVWLFKHQLFGDISGTFLTLGGMSFFVVSLMLTIGIFKIRYILMAFRNLLSWLKIAPRRKVSDQERNVHSHEDFFALERRSKMNLFAIVVPTILGAIYGAFFAFWYDGIVLSQGIINVSVYGAIYGAIMFLLVKANWFSYFYFAKEQENDKFFI